MEQTFFLLTTLIESGDCTSDEHSLYRYKEKSIEAFKDEIHDCAENFGGQKVDFIIDLPMCKEWGMKMVTVIPLQWKMLNLLISKV